MTDHVLPHPIHNKVRLIGSPTDIGASMRGASLGPEALRVAGLREVELKIYPQARHELLPTAGVQLVPVPTATDHDAQVGALPLCAFAYVARLSSDLSTLPFASYLTGSTREARDRASCAEYGRGIALARPLLVVQAVLGKADGGDVARLVQVFGAGKQLLQHVQRLVLAEHHALEVALQRLQLASVVV